MEQGLCTFISGHRADEQDNPRGYTLGLIAASYYL